MTSQDQTTLSIIKADTELRRLERLEDDLTRQLRAIEVARRQCLHDIRRLSELSRLEQIEKEAQAVWLGSLGQGDSAMTDKLRSALQTANDLVVAHTVQLSDYPDRDSYRKKLTLALLAKDAANEAASQQH